MTFPSNHVYQQKIIEIPILRKTKRYPLFVPTDVPVHEDKILCENEDLISDFFRNENQLFSQPDWTNNVNLVGVDFDCVLPLDFKNAVIAGIQDDINNQKSCDVLLCGPDAVENFMSSGKYVEKYKEKNSRIDSGRSKKLNICWIDTKYFKDGKKLYSEKMKASGNCFMESTSFVVEVNINRLYIHTQKDNNALLASGAICPDEDVFLASKAEKYMCNTSRCSDSNSKIQSKILTIPYPTLKWHTSDRLFTNCDGVTEDKKGIYPVPQINKSYVKQIIKRVYSMLHDK